MKIVVPEKDKKSTYFSDVKMGDVFMFRGGVGYYMRVETMRLMPNGDSVNNVCLSTGACCYAKDNQAVDLIDCELVVK